MIHPSRHDMVVLTMSICITCELIQVDMTSPPQTDGTLHRSDSAPSIAVEDYICRAEELAHYGLYQLTIWTTAATMSLAEWSRYLSATRIRSSLGLPPGQRYDRGDQWQTRALMDSDHSLIKKGQIRVTVFHKDEKTPLLIGIGPCCYGPSSSFRTCADPWQGPTSLTRIARAIRNGVPSSYLSSSSLGGGLVTYMERRTHGHLL